jgi:ABC-type amino acid transport system permease subunit
VPLDPKVIAGLPLLAAGLLTTVELCFGALAVSLVFGHIGMFLSISRWAPLRLIARTYVSLTRNARAGATFVLFTRCR